ncbi:aldehyde reductase [Mucilaginibacter sp. SG564]|uniref:SDR family oxidoreductase n=1 Tax=Mucilaginibacter sp. SG564 TaxID=2587022 RepID=UPI00155237E6|nr:aldehyde reductase [Mucilaginibacter sp. SG564]NOW97936.1 nucleoside-diphosphate-sugar epimerase [Mucilaginibacter sp. SG564]
MENSAKDTWVLVTGGTGFVGVHVILQLMQKGYKVKTTLRSLKRKEEVLDMLRHGGIADFKNLRFIEADLMKDDNWKEAVRNCTYVLHIASPIFLALPKDENEMIRPAVDGTLRVLKAARDAGVKRVVMTSNFGAVGYSHKDPYTAITEKEWTDPNEKGLSSYNKSKVMAERAAWDFIQREGGSLELSAINPVGIFGPSLGPDISSGFELVKNLLDGTMMAIPNLTLNIIDVRDVADLHVRAMTSPAAKGERFLALAGGKISMPEIAGLLREKMPVISAKVSTKTLPDWVVRIVALFSPKAKAIASMLKASRNVSNGKARNVLGWEPIATNEEAILLSVESMLKFGNIR